MRREICDAKTSCFSTPGDAYGMPRRAWEPTWIPLFAIFSHLRARDVVEGTDAFHSTRPLPRWLARTDLCLVLLTHAELLPCRSTSW